MCEQMAVKVAEADSGFGFLVEKFSGSERIPSLPEICEWLAEAEITDEEIAPYRHFDAEQYTRNRVFSNKFVEILVLCWAPGQVSLIHDHNGSHGVIRVFEGKIMETRFDRDANRRLRPGSTQSVGTGGIAGVGEPDIHQLSSADGENSLTIHVYAPPLKGLNIYEVGSTESRFYPLD